MSSTQEIRKANSQLSQLDTIVREQNHIYVGAVLNKTNNINHQIPSSRYLELSDPDSIGDTILHRVAKHYSPRYFDMILMHGADPTIKNSEGSTAIHEAIKQGDRLSIKTRNKFIKAMLQAQLKLKIQENPSDRNGISHFHAACLADDTEAVEYFLNNGVPIDQPIHEDSPILPGCTSVHLAALACAPKTVKILLNYGANVQTKDAKGMTSLDVLLKQRLEILNAFNNETARNSFVMQHHFPVQLNVRRKYYEWAKKDYKMIERIAHLFLENFLTHKEVSKNTTEFFAYFSIACTMSDTTVLELLLESDLDFNNIFSTKGLQGYTALHFAARFNSNALKLLLKKGADIGVKDSQGFTPFDICLENYSVEDISSIISSVPDWSSIVLSDGQTKLADLIYAMREVNHFDAVLKNTSENSTLRIPNESPLWPGCTPLHIVVALNPRINRYHYVGPKLLEYCELIGVCVDRGFKIEDQDVNGSTPVHLVFRLTNRANFLFPFDVGTFANPVDDVGLSHLHVACLSNNESQVEQLLLNGANVNAAVKSSVTFKDDSSDAVSDKPIVNNILNTGSTPLHCAVKIGSPGIVKLLLKFGADPYAKDSHGMSPIHNAIIGTVPCDKGSEILRLLPGLEDRVTVKGISHLHAASYVNSVETVGNLLNQGSDINAKVTCQSNSSTDTTNPMDLLRKYEGFTALNFAFMNKAVNALEFLVQHGADLLVRDNGSTSLYEIMKCRRVSKGVVIKALKADVELQERMEKHTGLTMLHVACNIIDPVLVENLLNEQALVNKSTHLDSPIWPGCTPLHCLMKACKRSWFGESFFKGAFRILELLLNKGADVTLPNADLDTPLHLAYEVTCLSRGKLNMMRTTKGLKNFDINPINRAGISHFDIVCSANDAAAVRKFLEINPNIDVNEPIDYLCKQFPGYSPLHLAVDYITKQTADIPLQIETIKVLLENGADINAKDSRGNTPLLVAVEKDSSSVELFEALILGGADINAENMCRQTALEILIKARKAKTKEIEVFLKYGSAANHFNSLTEEGCLAMILSGRYHHRFQRLVFKLLTEVPNWIGLDEQGRSVIHNVVSTCSPLITEADYVQIFDKFMELGCDVDSQDNFGRTALHIAAQFRNKKAISSLLKVGADCNILDTKNNLAFDYLFEHYKFKCDANETLQEEIIRYFAIHVQWLQLCGLEVHPQNESLKIGAFEKFPFEIDIDEISRAYHTELEVARNVKIGSNNRALSDFLTETGAVTSYPTMKFTEREILKDMFGPNKHMLYTQFVGLVGPLRLQYKKAVARLPLMQPSQESLRVISKYYGFPDLCCEAIFKFLPNKDLLTLIDTANEILNDTVT